MRRIDQLPPAIKVHEFLQRFKTGYENLAPEKEFSVFLAMTLMAFISAYNPEALPKESADIIEFANTLGHTETHYYAFSALTALGAADGLRRMIQFRMILYKAYIQVFILNNYQQDQDS